MAALSWMLLEAIEDLCVSRLRSILTMLGIIIGVSAVIVMLAVISGTSEDYRRKIESLGTNTLSVWPKARSGVQFDLALPPSLTNADSLAIGSLQGVRAAAPLVNMSGQVVHSARARKTSIIGTTHEYLRIRAWNVALGSTFSVADNRSARPVALLGAAVAKELFGDGMPVGQSIRINGKLFRVLGVLGLKGRTFRVDEDDCVIIPLRTLQRHLASNVLRRYLTAILIEHRPGWTVQEIQAAVTRLLRMRHRLRVREDDDFGISNAAELNVVVSALEQGRSSMLGAVGSISLLVGGIGIMNVMLVSVAERTREIGLRKALGATRGMIAAQFLIEAIVLAIAGCAIGVLLGTVIAYVMSWALGVTTMVKAVSIVAAVGVSLAVGLFFGWYPARRASWLEPSDALRHH